MYGNSLIWGVGGRERVIGRLVSLSILTEWLLQEDLGSLECFDRLVARREKMQCLAFVLQRVSGGRVVCLQIMMCAYSNRKFDPLH